MKIGSWRQLLCLVLRLLLAAIFVYASVDKIFHPREFAAILPQYHVIPASMTNLVAIVLPWLELVLGMSLLVGVGLEGSIVLTNLLLLSFLSLLIFNMARGLDVHCGCFSTTWKMPAQEPVWYVFRDAFFLLLSLLLTGVHFYGVCTGDEEYQKSWPCFVALS